MGVQCGNVEWNDIVDEFASQANGNSIGSVIRRLRLAASIYLLWQERNCRIFRGEKRGWEEFYNLCYETVIRLRLLSLKVKPSKAVYIAQKNWNADAEFQDKICISIKVTSGYTQSHPAKTRPYPVTSGQDPAITGHIRLDPAISGHIRLDPAISGHIRPRPGYNRSHPVRPGHIRSYPVRPGHIRSHPAKTRPHPVRPGHIRSHPGLTSSGFFRSLVMKNYDHWGNVICTGKDSLIRDGHKSFPSGHTSYVSRVDDYWHHWHDVSVGSYRFVSIFISSAQSFRLHGSFNIYLWRESVNLAVITNESPMMVPGSSRAPTSGLQLQMLTPDYVGQYLTTYPWHFISGTRHLGMPQMVTPLCRVGSSMPGHINNCVPRPKSVNLQMMVPWSSRVPTLGAHPMVIPTIYQANQTPQASGYFESSNATHLSNIVSITRTR
ncbi:Zinc finger, C2H2-type matrin (chloroplast) [Artemisia annua]|uniref:Zinc finger, C2H2-type matrin n=1 Tax=Artemisia annua TaxID=35608 RepID=A0A2U1QFZ4_ARTAN|nr:Zinc finger, C2H2-type matrin [Artemisia annua]